MFSRFQTQLRVEQYLRERALLQLQSPAQDMTKISPRISYRAMQVPHRSDEI